MSETYNINMVMTSPWRVGYQCELDEIFLFKIDSDNLIWIFRHGRLDALFFAEFVSNAPWIELGDL